VEFNSRKKLHVAFLATWTILRGRPTSLSTADAVRMERAKTIKINAKSIAKDCALFNFALLGVTVTGGMHSIAELPGLT